MNRPYKVMLSTLELEYLLSLLDCEDGLEEESRHIASEHDLREDVIAAVKGFKNTDAE